MNAPSRPKNATRRTVSTQLLREWIEAGEPAWLPVTGHSMAPFLPGGSKVLVTRTPPGLIGRGDLVVYEDEGRMICHRVLWRRPQGSNHAFLTKGDGWRMMDPWVSATQIIGKVVAINRNGSISRLDTPLRRLGAVVAAVCSFAKAGSREMLRRARGLLSLRRMALTPRPISSDKTPEAGFQG